MESIKTASLFCGCGGMDLGIHGGFDYLENHYPRLPFEVVHAIDNDLYAARIYNDNFRHKCEVKDIRGIDPEKLPDHDLLIGGFPCQSFSISAQNPPRLGYKDERGKLFFEMANIIKIKRPRFFIAENVKGLLSANNGKAFPMIVKTFENAGYYVKHNLFDASGFGVPQKRQRVFMVGFRNYKDFAYFNFPSPLSPDWKKTKLKEVIDPDANKNEKWFFSQEAVQGMLKVKEKMNKGRAQDLEGPCNTISSHLAKASLNSTDPVLMVNGRYRRFTPREAASIQSFPKSFKLKSVSENRQYKAIGNAVPPVLMWHIGKALVQVLEQETNVHGHTGQTHFSLVSNVQIQKIYA